MRSLRNNWHVHEMTTLSGWGACQLWRRAPLTHSRRMLSLIALMTKMIYRECYADFQKTQANMVRSSEVTSAATVLIAHSAISPWCPCS
jgi:hypothetical protein